MGHSMRGVDKKNCPPGDSGGQKRDSLNMRMVINVVLTIAVIALTPGAIPEFQLWVAYIRSSANGAAVGIGSFGCSGGCLIGACTGERDNLGPA